MKHLPFALTVLLLISACVNVEVIQPKQKEKAPTKYEHNIMYAELK